jgi:FixJ family two-component response regulator
MTPNPASGAAPDVGEGVVFVVDDDAGIRSALRRLLKLHGLMVELFASGGEFLDRANLRRSGCLLLDVRMPGMNGLEVQAQLNERRIPLPVIFLTGASDIPMAVAAMRQGAVDFIEKPFDNRHLLARVRQALDQARSRIQRSADRDAVLSRCNSLTPREREVLELVTVGKTAKEIARTLGASHRTIEIHRGHLMEKMGASTLAELVRMRLLAEGDGVDPASTTT